MSLRKHKTRINLRITDTSVWDMLSALNKTKIFPSMNILLNKIIAFSINDFAAEYGIVKTVKTSLQSEECKDIFTDLKQIKAVTEDAYVLLMTLERLLSALYNSKVAELQGITVSAEEFTIGLLSELPNELQTVKDEIIRLRAGRVKK